MNSTTLQICIKYGLITRTNDLYTVGEGDKYKAAFDLRLAANVSHSVAMRRINALIERVNSGLDPTKDNRGGTRKGAGRKKVIVTPPA